MSSFLRGFISCLFLTDPCCAAVTYYVSPSGNDHGSGTATEPFASIQTGVDHLNPGDTLSIQAGTYFGAVQVNHSGTDSNPMTIQAQQGEGVTLVGAKPLGGPWKKDRGSIYRAPWPTQPNQVFCDGRLLNEARWPRAEVEGLSHQPVAVADAGSPTFTACSKLPPLDLTGALIQIMPGQSWCAYTRTIVSHDRAKGILVFSSPVSEMAPLFPRKGDRFYVFGKRELLGAPGEWWWDPDQKMLCVWAPDGKDPAGRVEAGDASWVLSLDAQSYVVVKGLQARGGWLSLHLSQHCVVQDCDLMAPNWNREVDGYKVQPFLLGGGDLSGNDNEWLGGTIRFAGRCGINAMGTGQTIRGVTVEDCGWNWSSDAGIFLNGCDQCVIQDCTVRRVARMGLDLVKASQCKVLHNSVEDVCLYSNDGGDLDSWGTDGQGTEVAYNTFGRNLSYWGGGLYLDDNVKNFYCHDNLILDIAWEGIIFKAVNRIENNTVVSAGHQGIMVYPPAGASLQGGILAHNQAPEAYPLWVSLASPSVTDWGYYGGYAYLSKAPGRVEIDWSQLTQQGWAKQVPLDLTKVVSVRFGLENPVTFQFSAANLRFLPLGQTGDQGAVTVTGTSWFFAAGAGSTGQIGPQGPVAWGASGTNVLFGWSVLTASLPGGGVDLTGYRGMAFNFEGKADRINAIDGLADTDNGPETVEGRGAHLKP